MQYFTHQSTSMEMITDLLKALNGEYHAIHCYKLLSDQAPNTEIKNRILEIRNDEIRHYRMFAQIYTSLTGEQTSPQLTEKCPSNFRSGMVAAFMDEQNTVDFYHTVARKYNNPAVKDAFTQASADEQNHAVWFLYYLNQQ